MANQRPINHIERALPNGREIEQALMNLNELGYRLLEISEAERTATGTLILIGERVKGSAAQESLWDLHYDATVTKQR